MKKSYHNKLNLSRDHILCSYRYICIDTTIVYVGFSNKLCITLFINKLVKLVKVFHYLLAVVISSLCVQSFLKTKKLNKLYNSFLFNNGIYDL